jgi:DNA-binding GntR family transcriptional regulator
MSERSLSRNIVEQIALLVKSGDLAAGEHVRSQHLADRFGVSRSPVREALEILVRQGLFDQKENRGFFVKDVPSWDLAEPVSDVAKPSETEEDYQRLAEDWLTDKIPSEVAEGWLRERYQVTKTQLSAMLMRAVREGWAERKQGYGWRLLPVAKTKEAFEQIYRFRLLIEPAAMLEPGFAPDSMIINEQRRIQSRMLETGIKRLPAEHLLHNGSLFHEELIKMSNNPFFLLSLVRVNRMRRLLEYRSRIDRKRLVIQCQDHLAILDLLERGEVREASEAMRRHLSGALDSKSPIAWSQSQATRESC